MTETRGTKVVDYSGWRPRALRLGKSSSETGARRETKRSRLGNRRDRALYKSVKGPKTDADRYAQLCEVADNLNGRRRRAVE